ncbi:MAG: hypothetical protein WBF58_12630 [Xanthobacteraceae bacterium]
MAPVVSATSANVFIAAVILVLFVAAAAVSAVRKDITRGFDEVAQASYVAEIQHAGDPWPAFGKLRLLDPRTFEFTGTPNYLNHPPIFYALLAALGPRLEGHPSNLLAHRLLDVALAAIGLAALLGLGLCARFTRPEFYAYAVPIACIPVLAPLAGALDNDDLAFLGGAIATLGVWQALASGRERWLALALAGVVAAAWAKLTGLVLAGGLVVAVAGYLLWRRRLRRTWLVGIAVALLFAAAPYLIYLGQYGEPVPSTPGFYAFMNTEVRAFGWDTLPRMSFPAYVVWFAGQFIANWMPTLAQRNVTQYALLGIPAAALACAAAGVVASLRRLMRRQEAATDVVVIAGALAIAVSLVLHVRFSYHFYAATGWQAGPYPRYYLPLAAIVPLAGLSLAAAIKNPSWRTALLVFLITGPIAFRIFGAPLG